MTAAEMTTRLTILAARERGLTAGPARDAVRREVAALTAARDAARAARRAR